MVGIVESLLHFISNGKDSSLSRSLNHHTQPKKSYIQFKRGQFWTYPTLKTIKIFIGRLSLSRVKGKTLSLHSTADETVHGLISALIHKQQAHNGINVLWQLHYAVKGQKQFGRFYLLLDLNQWLSPYESETLTAELSRSSWVKSEKIDPYKSKRKPPEFPLFDYTSGGGALRKRKKRYHYMKWSSG